MIYDQLCVEMPDKELTNEAKREANLKEERFQLKLPSVSFETFFSWMYIRGDRDPETAIAAAKCGCKKYPDLSRNMRTIPAASTMSILRHREMREHGTA